MGFLFNVKEIIGFRMVRLPRTEPRFRDPSRNKPIIENPRDADDSSALYCQLIL